MDPQAALALLLACAGATETPATAGGDLSEVESVAESLQDWLDNGGSPWSLATYDEVNIMRSIATEYENSVPAELFSEGAAPGEVALMVNTLAGALEPFCTE